VHVVASTGRRVLAAGLPQPWGAGRLLGQRGAGEWVARFSLWQADNTGCMAQPANVAPAASSCAKRTTRIMKEPRLVGAGLFLFYSGYRPNSDSSLEMLSDEESIFLIK
jgi:hypothetical protein